MASFVDRAVIHLVARRAGIAARPLTARRAPGHATMADSALTGGVVATGSPVWHPVGCAECGDGYHGGPAVYEVIVDAALRALTHDGAAESALAATARRAGPGLADDGAAKVASGITSVAEVARVVRNDG